ncbi:MAG: hypothetical protein KC416_07040, partial [Myxococcales bacterium]|nr:hypothetical protein [Myxococcales bacterium]
GRQITPVEIEKIEKPSAAERRYFPSISPFRQTFRIAFPTVADDGTPTIPARARYVILRFAGSAGVVDLRWAFVP